MIYDKYLVSCIVLALSEYGYRTFCAKDTLLDSMIWLRESYTRTKEDTLLIKAVNHAYAYLEMGFDYNDGKDIFEMLADDLKMCVEEVFPAKKWLYKKQPLTKAAIRNLLGRWNPNLQSMKIQDVVQDIYDNIQYQRKGEYLYHSGRVMMQDGERKLWESTYRLYITDRENIFYDVNHNKYYAFEKGRTYDKYSDNR